MAASLQLNQTKRSSAAQKRKSMLFPVSHGYLLTTALLLGVSFSTLGCTTMRLEDTLPASSAAPPPISAEVASSVSGTGEAGESALDAPPAEIGAQPAPGQTGAVPATSGSFPNLNLRPQPANSQMSAAQRDQRTEELRAAQQRVQTTGGRAAASALTAEQMRRLAREREEQTLRRIEGR